MNWKAFEVKNEHKEAWAFEQMSYLLFCSELNNHIGLFRYKNQAGVETEPIEKDGKYYGFQSKFYTDTISKKKKDLIDSIRKSKAKNPQLNEIYFYINQEFSESSSKNSKKPQYQLEIEKVAEQEGITIQWRVRSHLELQLSLPKNEYIKDLFFNLEPNKTDLIDEVFKHNEQLLGAIQTEIVFGTEKIKIDRSDLIESIANISLEGKNIIISGEGGCGKTSILKEFYNTYYKNIPICIFKANELNVSHINDIFHIEHKFTFVDFLNIYKDETVKTFVIDSAERLAEISNNDILTTLIPQLKENNWNIIFTTRNVYLNDLSFLLKENFQSPSEVTCIPPIDTERLKIFSDKLSFSLPNNRKFIERLSNLFYLRE